MSAKGFHILLILLLSGTLMTAQSHEGKDGYKLHTVVFDAGHGGYDVGCHGKTTYERNVALGIILKLGHYIKENFPDVKVIYTRDKDIFVPLN